MSADLEIPAFSGTKDRERVYLDIAVTRRKRWFASCNSHVVSIPQPRTLALVEASVRKSALRAFRDYWGSTTPGDKYDVYVTPEMIRIECEVRGFEYIASTEKLEVRHV